MARCTAIPSWNAGGYPEWKGPAIRVDRSGVQQFIRISIKMVVQTKTLSKCKPLRGTLSRLGLSQLIARKSGTRDDMVDTRRRPVGDREFSNNRTCAFN